MNIKGTVNCTMDINVSLSKPQQSYHSTFDEPDEKDSGIPRSDRMVP